MSEQDDKSLPDSDSEIQIVKRRLVKQKSTANDLDKRFDGEGDETKNATLDEYPPIADSGRPAVKAIINNPLVIDMADVDPMHKRTFAKLLPLR